MRDIKPTDNNGSIQLRFSVAGKRYGFNPIPGGSYHSRNDYKMAEAIAHRIQLDILSGNFDPTLDKYRLYQQKQETQPETLLELWDLWIPTLNLPAYTLANHYRYCRSLIAKYDPKIGDIDWLKNYQASPATLKDRIGHIKSCCQWALEEGLIAKNPYTSYRLPRLDKKPVQPFSTQEIELILSGFNQYHPHYLTFVRFLFMTGTRLSEAIGLRWQHVDLSKKELTICESLSKDFLGNGYQRIQKGTKTGSIRVLSIHEELQHIFELQKCLTGDRNGLVFKSPNNKTIDADNWRSRQWMRVLTAQGVPYRNPHVIRHTVLSMAVEQGMPITGVAYLAGHSDSRMVLSTYGHVLNRPKLPKVVP